ncbi:MAG TPA: class I SAM-dependent methyltransferase [Solirubrobacteraceae bacterium]|jgi:SAM-dependent methyltransferase
MRERRLVFGEVAEQYDRYRPTYPPELVDDLIALAGLDGTQAVLDVGAGTGKATVLFALRGIPVVAIEPNANMAAVARRNLSRFAHVTIEEADFEAWLPRGRRFPLLVSGQAWHWVAREVGYAKAHDVLAQEGILAAFWNRVAWEKADIREALLEVYARAGSDLSVDGPMHPANASADTEAAWDAGAAADHGLHDAEVRLYEWEQRYATAEYVGLLATASEVRLLSEERREPFLAAVAEAIDAHGEPLSIPMRTLLCLARRGRKTA